MTKLKSGNHHVVYNRKKELWEVKRDYAERASRIFATKKEAVAAGRKISASQKTELKIHNKNGRISASDSHGNDPFPPKG